MILTIIRIYEKYFCFGNICEILISKWTKMLVNTIYHLHRLRIGHRRQSSDGHRICNIPNA